MDDILPGWEDKRFRPFKLGRFFGDTDLYGIEDTSYNYPYDRILRNWQKGKRTKQIYKAPLEDVIHVCTLLNRDQKVMIDSTHGFTSDTQVRYYSNTTTARKRRTVPSLAAFKKCDCGARYKGEKHC